MTETTQPETPQPVNAADVLAARLTELRKAAAEATERLQLYHNLHQQILGAIVELERLQAVLALPQDVPAAAPPAE